MVVERRASIVGLAGDSRYLYLFVVFLPLHSQLQQALWPRLSTVATILVAHKDFVLIIGRLQLTYQRRLLTYSSMETSFNTSLRVNNCHSSDVNELFFDALPCKLTQ